MEEALPLPVGLAGALLCAIFAGVNRCHVNSNCQCSTRSLVMGHAVVPPAAVSAGFWEIENLCCFRRNGVSLVPENETLRFALVEDLVALLPPWVLLWKCNRSGI